MSRPTSKPLRVEPVAPGEASQALELALAHLEPHERARRRAARDDGSNCGLWAAYRDDRMVGVMRAAVQMGRSAIVEVPRLAEGEPGASATELLERVVEKLPEQGVLLAQALVMCDNRRDSELLVAGGFRHASDMLYLVSTSGAFPDQSPGRELEFVAYSPALHARLAAVVERTYAGSLDCQAVDGVRPVDDVLAGYRAADALDARQWHLVRHEGYDVGCLLLSGDAENDQWELTYMGVVAEARRRGLGLSIVRHAQWLARQAGRGRLVLAVDAANAPAIATYAAAGFAAWERRMVFLRVF